MVKVVLNIYRDGLCPGELAEVEDSVARDLINGGYASLWDIPVKKKEPNAKSGPATE